MITVQPATDAARWDAFLGMQRYRPFLQSWTMGEVYRAIKQEPVRLEALDAGKTVGICFGHVVPARRGRHLSIPYGPIVELQEEREKRKEIVTALLKELAAVGKEYNCSFIRMSPFWNAGDAECPTIPGAKQSPLHLLAEHLWYLPLKNPDQWTTSAPFAPSVSSSPDDLFKNFRATHRNLIRRAQKEGVTIERSMKPNQDIEHFLTLHEETRKRHGFTPYSNAFFRTQLELFAARGEATLYQAHYQGRVISSSIHMHVAGETSYHHGASTHAFAKIPSSYLLQWTAIEDAIKRGDHVYNFWGIAPQHSPESSVVNAQSSDSQLKTHNSQFKRHPFAGVTLFKTGFGGKLLELTHCVDVPLKPSYVLTRGFEFLRKWKRGF